MGATVSRARGFALGLFLFEKQDVGQPFAKKMMAARSSMQPLRRNVFLIKSARNDFCAT